MSAGIPSVFALAGGAYRPRPANRTAGGKIRFMQSIYQCVTIKLIIIHYETVLYKVGA